MPDYKELYLTLFRANEEAIRQLIAVQRQCEALYLSSELEATEVEARLADNG